MLECAGRNSGHTSYHLIFIKPYIMSVYARIIIICIHLHSVHALTLWGNMQKHPRGLTEIRRNNETYIHTTKT